MPFFCYVCGGYVNNGRCVITLRDKIGLVMGFICILIMGAIVLDIRDTPYPGSHEELASLPMEAQVEIAEVLRPDFQESCEDHDAELRAQDPPPAYLSYCDEDEDVSECIIRRRNDLGYNAVWYC